MAELAQWFVEQGDFLDVLAPSPAASSDPRIALHPIDYAKHPRLFFGAGAPDNLQHWRSWLQVPNFLFKLGQNCQKQSPHWQGMISHWLLPCGLMASLTAPHLPHVAIAHSSDVHLLRRLPFSSLVLHQLAKPRTSLVLTSEGLRGHLSPLAHSRRAHNLIETAEVIRMGIRPPLPKPNASALNALRKAHGLLNRRLVLFLGRLVPVKGVDILLKACAPLRELSVVVIGDGPEGSSLQKLASQRKLDCHFLGPLYGQKKAAWLHAADLFVLPSIVLPDGRTDSAPLVLLEAMAAGLPVIASRVGGNAELISHAENGILVPPGEVGALREAIAQLGQNQSLRSCLSQAGLRTAEKYYWSVLGPKLRRLLR